MNNDCEVIYLDKEREKRNLILESQLRSINTPELIFYFTGSEYLYLDTNKNVFYELVGEDRLCFNNIDDFINHYIYHITVKYKSQKVIGL
jgi:hypothetical protein